MAGRSAARICVWLIAIATAASGCAGVMRTAPDDPTSAGGLTPSIQDPEAGLVAVAPGFDIRRYRTVVVERFPVAARDTRDEGDRRFAANMSYKLQIELVLRLSDSGVFSEVINTSRAERPSADAPALRLQGAITRLGRGSGAGRHFLGLFGGGTTRAQVDTQLVDVASNRVVVVTADRRLNSTGGFAGGSDEDLLGESLNDIARDLARFLARLSRGEVPRGRLAQESASTSAARPTSAFFLRSSCASSARSSGNVRLTTARMRFCRKSSSVWAISVSVT